MPCAAATALPSSTRPVTSARRPGRSQTRPCVRPVSAPIGFVDGVEDHLAPLRRRGRRRRPSSGMPPRVQASASARSPPRGGRAAARTGRTSCRPSRPTARGRARAACRPGTSCPRITRSTCSAIVSSLPTPFMHRGDGAVRERVRRRRDRRARRASPSSRRSRSRTAAARPRRSSPAAARRTSPAPESRSPSRVDRVDVRLGEVERPHLDVVERGEVRREERADRAAADDADSHDAVSSGIGADGSHGRAAARGRR